jgi:broad specificity phosphatase PhoE
MRLFVTRHGQTEWNVADLICGVTDVALTELGVAQAHDLAERLSTYQIDRIYVSPLKRAVATAEIVAGARGVGFTVDSRLTEQNYGIFEGVYRKDARFLAAKRNFLCRYPGGESAGLVAQRVYNLIDEVKERFAEQNILFVTHGGVCRVIETYFNDLTNEDYFRFGIKNCELKIYDTSCAGGSTRMRGR